MRIARTVAVIALLLQGIVGSAQEPSEQEAVTRAISCFADTWNRHDMRAFGQCFASDADFVNVTTQWWKGRVTIEKNHAFMHAIIDASDLTGVKVPPGTYGMFKSSSFVFTSMEARFVHPDIAIAHAAWKMIGDARTAEARTRLMTLVMTRTGGNWLISAAQNTENNRTVR